MQACYRYITAHVPKTRAAGSLPIGVGIRDTTYMPRGTPQATHMHAVVTLEYGFSKCTKGHLHVFEPGLSFPNQVLGQHRLSADMPRREPTSSSRSSSEEV